MSGQSKSGTHTSGVLHCTLITTGFLRGLEKYGKKNMEKYLHFQTIAPI